MINGEYWLVEVNQFWPEKKRVLFFKDRMSSNTAVLYLTEDSARRAVKALEVYGSADRQQPRIVHVRIEEIND